MEKKEKSTTKLCKHCQSEIPIKAKVCPHCRKKVKGGFLKWIIIAIVLLIIFSSAGGEEKVDTISTNTEFSKDTTKIQVQPTTPILSKQTEYYVGDVLMDGNLKIVYMSSGEYIEENIYSQPEEGSKYIFLQFAFENTSKNTDASISIYNFEGYADGYAVDMYYGGEKDISATLSAGRTNSGYIYFCVPEDAQTIEIEYTPNIFLNDKYTFVYEGEKNSNYVPTVNTTASADVFNVGDVIEANDLTITYLSCEEYISNNQFVQPKDGNRYITCTFEFENTGKSDQYVSSYDFDCYADGVNCTATYIRDDDLSATLSAGRKTKGTVTFEVPTDATVIEVEYLTNYWTSGRIVFSVS